MNQQPHRRLNILTNEWIFVSPHRMKRPWQGKKEIRSAVVQPAYDPTCYLCPGNKRADGAINPPYTGPFSFDNDFAALLPEGITDTNNDMDLLVSEGVKGICKVICFSPKHHVTLTELSESEITDVIQLWQDEFVSLSENEFIKYIQIFENKGAIMGCSNPHPHCQIWSSSVVPNEVEKESQTQQTYYLKHRRTLLSDYLAKEIAAGERLIIENESFGVVVPYWATWPFETLVISKRPIQHITQLNQKEVADYAAILKKLSTIYDRLFDISFPYSAGIHQAPVNSGNMDYWHFHMHFYPPLLRSADVKKFMVGYEMLANAQRDITPEHAANQLKQLL